MIHNASKFETMTGMVYLFMYRDKNKKEMTKLSYDIGFTPIIRMLLVDIEIVPYLPLGKKTEQPTLLHLTEM